MPAQDYELWVRILNDGHRGDNLHAALTRYRGHPDSETAKRADAYRDAASTISAAQIRRFAPHVPNALASPRLRFLGVSVLTGSLLPYYKGDSQLVDLLTATLEDFLEASNADAKCAAELRDRVAAGCTRHLAQRRTDKAGWLANQCMKPTALRRVLRYLQKSIRAFLR